MNQSNCMVAQSGGPTAAINASLAGVISGIKKSGKYDTCYGAINGILGILNERYLNLSQMIPDEKTLNRLKVTPAMYLGSCRHKLPDYKDDDSAYVFIFNQFAKLNIKAFFYIGGNDSMDTVSKLSRYAAISGSEICFIGIPKTIDNDLFGTDHCPGYASAAKYIATSIMEVSRDAHVYDTGMITIIECMGRHAGWLTAATALAGAKGDGPDLIYLPEVDFNMEDFLDDVIRVYNGRGSCLVAVSEGIHYADGAFVSEAKASSTDGFGHAQLGGLAARLANIVKAATGAKVRGIELSLLQRCAAHCASGTDIEESFNSGKLAVEAALRGESGKMVGFRCDRKDGYVCHYELFNLEDVANYEKKVPLEWVNADHTAMTDEFLAYALPLVQAELTPIYIDGVPRHLHLH